MPAPTSNEGSGTGRPFRTKAEMVDRNPGAEPSVACHHADLLLIDVKAKSSETLKPLQPSDSAGESGLGASTTPSSEARARKLVEACCCTCASPSESGVPLGPWTSL